ncbi:secretin N-terminal domain-containing protein [Kushneria sp. Sum13]|uniref:secretin N-terminal domain-containing protein n=1 Tax=Kushneria sp. Sum13 TaxID=3459196 RepID=UPI0040453BEB
MWKSVASLSLALASITAHATPIQMQDADLREFVQWYAEHTGSPVAVDPAVSGTVTAWAEDVSDEQLPEFFRGVLRANGYQVTPGNPPVVAPISGPVDGFMQELDVPRVALESRVYTFDSIRADDALPVLDAFLTGNTGPTSTQAQLLRGSNGLLISATPEQLAQLDGLIPAIDQPSNQVLIQAILFETTEGDSLDFSFAAGRARPGASVGGGFNTSALGSQLGYAGGSFGIFDGNVLALALRSIRQDSQARILSTPQILTLSGQRGLISVGQNVPFVTGRVTGEAANINSPFQTIERRDVGVRLNVLPVVSHDGLIVMTISTTADSLSNSLAASDIITNQRSIESTVQIRSGQALLLGGLVSEEESEYDSSVPVLSDIPLIGGLFRSTSKSYQQRKLYVLLKATVLPGTTQANTVAAES